MHPQSSMNKQGHRRRTTTDRDNVDKDEEDDRTIDQRERKAFEERLKKRDEDKTKNIMVKGMSKSEVEEVQARNRAGELLGDERSDTLRKLKEKSRMEYLKQREPKKFRELMEGIQDEQFLFGDKKLSQAEQAQHAANQILYRATKEARDMVDTTYEGYMLPQGEFDEDGKIDQKKKWEKLTQRYERRAEDAQAMKMFSEQNEFEDSQMQKSTNFHVGAKKQIKKGQDKKDDQKMEIDEEEYLGDEALLLDDQIEFLKDEILKGDNVEEAEQETQTKSQAATLAEVRRSLPIFAWREQLLEAVEKYQVLVIVGETGSGKTTQIPQYLREAGYCKDGKKIACTQPRRVAAMSVAKRVADEMDCRLGHEVGYSIRFEDCTTPKTEIKYMTDGMLLREFLGEPDLKSYSVLMIDEAHERTLHTDILFGLVKDVALFRPDLKLIISSATLDASRFQNYMDGAPLFKIPGRRYPVDVFYTQAPEADYIDAAIVTALQIHVTQGDGDILIFLTGQEEVDTTADALAARTRGLGNKIKELIVCRIYSTLPSDLQAKIFEPTPPGARKVIVATNIAETSLTIDGICFVIDAGFCKQNTYDPRTGMESLIVTPISRASAQQRAGRAGRTAPGKCYRLFTKWAFYNELEENTVPEIQRTNLGNVVLMLKSLGIDDLLHFDFMDPPPAETLIRALEHLYALGALNDRGELTKLGRRMAEFPVDPQLSKTIVAAEQYTCVEEILTISAMLSVGGAIFYKPKDRALHAENAMRNFFRPFGDHMTLLNVYQQWAEGGYTMPWCFENFIQYKSMVRAHDVRDQLVGLCERTEIALTTNSDADAVRKAVAAGFFYHTAKLNKGGSYKTTKHGQSVLIHPSSCVYKEPPRWVLYHELVLTTKEFMRQVLEIKPEWLMEIAPHFFKKGDIEDEQKKKMPKKSGKATDFHFSKR